MHSLVVHFVEPDPEGLIEVQKRISFEARQKVGSDSAKNLSIFPLPCGL